MPVIIVYGIPEEEISKEKLLDIKKEMKEKVCQIKQLKLETKQVSVYFHKDYLPADIHREVVIFVDGLFSKPERNKKVRYELALELVDTVYGYFQSSPHIFIKCFVRPFNEAWGFASGGTMKAD